jgi:hypothetical protein
VAVEARLGGAVTPALSVVNVEVELKVDHLSVKLDESAWVAVHGTRQVERRNGRGVSLGMG